MSKENGKRTDGVVRFKSKIYKGGIQRKANVFLYKAKPVFIRPNPTFDTLRQVQDDTG